MQILSPQSLLRDGVARSVIEVFSTMLSLDIEQLDPQSAIPQPGERVVASVGFAGSATGMICVHVGEPYFRFLTAQMLGIDQAEVGSPEDENDAIGELANMIAGNIKTHLTSQAGLCSLSVPSIMRGTGIEIEGISSAHCEEFIFKQDANHLFLKLYVKASS